MIQMYRAGTSIVHRTPPGLKLALLVLAAVVVSAYPHDGWSVALVLGAVAALYVLARLPWRILLREVWRLRWIIVILGVALWVFVSPLTAWINTARLVALVLMASLLTLTTPMGELLDVVRWTVAPFRRFGADPDAVAMAVSLTLTMIPVVSGFSEAVRDAARARGVRLGVRGIVPLMVRTLRHSDDVGDALAARGLA